TLASYFVCGDALVHESRDFMKRRRHILGVVSLLMVVSVLDVILMDAIGSEPSPFSVWRLVITGVLAIFLALGNNLARWMAVLLTALAAFGGLAFIALLLVSGEFGPGAGVVLAWM